MENPHSSSKRRCPQWIFILPFTALLLSTVLVGYGKCQIINPIENEIETDDFEGHSNNVFLPFLRASKDLSGSQADRISNTPGFKQKTVLVGEIDFVYVSGESSDIVSGDGVLDYQEVRFPGQSKVTADSNLFALSAAIRAPFDLPGGIDSFEPFIGLGIQHLSLELASGTIKASDKTNTVGPMIGAQFSTKLFPWLDLSGRGSITLGMGDRLILLWIVIGGITVNIIPNIDLMAGWGLVEYREDRGSREATVELTFTGPTAGVFFQF